MGPQQEVSDCGSSMMGEVDDGGADKEVPAALTPSAPLLLAVQGHCTASDFCLTAAGAGVE